jgi:hypothetical protein
VWRLTLICDACGEKFGTDRPTDSLKYPGAGQFAFTEREISSGYVRDMALKDGWSRRGDHWSCPGCVKTEERYMAAMKARREVTA